MSFKFFSVGDHPYDVHFNSPGTYNQDSVDHQFIQTISREISPNSKSFIPFLNHQYANSKIQGQEFLNHLQELIKKEISWLRVYNVDRHIQLWLDRKRESISSELEDPRSKDSDDNDINDHFKDPLLISKVDKALKEQGFIDETGKWKIQANHLAGLLRALDGAGGTQSYYIRPLDFMGIQRVADSFKKHYRVSYSINTLRAQVNSDIIKKMNNLILNRIKL